MKDVYSIEYKNIKFKWSNKRFSLNIDAGKKPHHRSIGLSTNYNYHDEPMLDVGKCAIRII